MTRKIFRTKIPPGSSAKPSSRTTRIPDIRLPMVWPRKNSSLKP